MTFIRPREGRFYPRIYRGADMVFTLRGEATRTQTAVGIQLLVEELRSIFSVLQPHPRNRSAYGPRLRHLLLIACTEVEAGWTGILQANPPHPKRPTTRDYVKLAGPLQLADYNFKLRDYPEYPVMEPFAGWTASSPTQSLPWYDAYNRAKHDRERFGKDATLEVVLAAVAGAFAMASAQFGYQLFQPGGRFGQSLININGPLFHVQTEGYIPPPQGKSWKVASHPWR